MNCYTHDNTQSVAICLSCKKGLCKDCIDFSCNVCSCKNEICIKEIKMNIAIQKHIRNMYELTESNGEYLIKNNILKTSKKFSILIIIITFLYVTSFPLYDYGLFGNFLSSTEFLIFTTILFFGALISLYIKFSKTKNRK